MKYDIKSINKRIRNIKAKDLQPVTLKSVSDYYANIISPHGTSKEGEILTYNQAKKMYEQNFKGETLTQEQYQEYLNDLISSYGDQLSVIGAINYSFERAKGVLKYIENNDPYAYEQLMKMDRKKIVQILSEVGENTNMLTKMGYQSGDNYLELLNQWLEIYSGE